jgi:ankyrin repeat protein
MKAKRIQKITKFLPALMFSMVVVLFSLPAIGHAKDTATLDAQLIKAVLRGDLDRAKTCIAEGADINARDKRGWSVLMLAAKLGNSELVKLLLEKGVEVNAKDKSGWTAVALAASSGHKRIVRMLKDVGAEVTLRDAVIVGDADLVGQVLITGVAVNSQVRFGQTALTLAAEEGHLEVAKLILDKGADVNGKDYSGHSALMKAATRGDLEMLRLLLDKDADANAKSDGGWTALIGAAGSGHGEAVKLLLDKGADVNEGKNDLTALMAAAEEGHLEEVKLLLDKGADVNAKYEDGSTALMEAAAKYYGQNEPGPGLVKEILNALRGRWLGPRFPPRKQNRDPEVVTFLLRNGADINARTVDGWTALTRAQKGGSKEIVEILKAHGAKE